jgi:C_GCAxxG_C_C family probable redox protein
MRESVHRCCMRPEASPGRRAFLAAACCLGPGLKLGHTQEEYQGKKKDAAGSFLQTEDRITIALMRFREGYHCSQSVFEAYCADFDLDPELARRLSAALAGGSTVGGECGVIGSGYLVLGLKYAGDRAAYGDTEREDRLWSRVRRFLAEFKKRNGAITCRELLGVDTFSREGREEALRRNLFAARCQKYIRDGIEILDSLEF